MRIIHWTVIYLIFQQCKQTNAQNAGQVCREAVFATPEVKTIKTLDLVQKMASERRPGNPRLSKNCRFIIESSVGTRVKVTIRYVLRSTPAGCQTAQTDIYDRNSRNTPERRIAKWCGESESTFISWSNYMKVHAKRVHKIPREVEYSAVNDTQCSHRRSVKEGKVHTITSKGYPQKYKRNTECRWEINTLRQYYDNQTITLNFVDIDIKYSGECLFDYIRIYSDSTPHHSETVAELCHERNKTIELYIKYMLIVFKTGNEEAGKGFKLRYQAKNVSSCNKILSASSDRKELVSGRFPLPYPSFQRCTYLIQRSNSTMNINLEVIISRLGHCYEEYVLVYDGKTENSPLLGKCCSNHLPTFKSLTGSLYIVFVSSNNMVAKQQGFKVLYKEEMCGEEIIASLDKPTLTFPPVSYSYHLSEPITCKWTIKSKYRSYKVIVFFTNTYLSWPSSKIRVNAGSGYVWEFSKSPHQMYLSHWDRFNIELRSTGDSPVHFEMQYWIEDIQGCDGQAHFLIAKEQQQTIRSPGYPLRYPDLLRCVWKFETVSMLHKLGITVEVNELKKENCNDFIRFFHELVFDYSKPDLLLCGGETGTFNSKGRFATVYLYTDDHRGGRGFVLNYTSYKDELELQDTSSSSVNFPLIKAAAGGAVVLIVILIIVIVLVFVRRKRAACRQAEQELPNSRARDHTSPLLETNTSPAPAPVATPAATPALDSVPAAAVPLAPSAPRPPLNPSAPPPSYLELDTVTADRSRPSTPPLPPPSYEDAVSKGMIRDS